MTALTWLHEIEIISVFILLKVVDTIRPVLDAIWVEKRIKAASKVLSVVINNQATWGRRMTVIFFARPCCDAIICLCCSFAPVYSCHQLFFHGNVAGTRGYK
jgi:hypothetical protein